MNTSAEKFLLIDTFNKTEISRHRSIAAAVKADRKFCRAVKRSNGESSYIPTEIRSSTGRVIHDEITEARIEADRG